MARGSYIYGRHPIAEALRRRPKSIERMYVARASARRLQDLIRRSEDLGIKVVETAKRNLVDLVGDVAHQGIVAVVESFQYSDTSAMLESARQLDEAPLIVALDQVQDPHNVGAIARSAQALGAHGMIIPKNRACEITPSVVKASAGATAHLHVARVTNLRRALDELKEAGMWIVGTVAKDGHPLRAIDFIQPIVIVVGSEGKGMRKSISECCDLHAHIPLGGRLASLNASVAAAITLYEAQRQRIEAS